MRNDDYTRQVVTFVPGVPLRRGPLVYVGTTRLWFVFRALTDDDVRAKVEGPADSVSVKYVRLSDIISIERGERGWTDIRWSSPFNQYGEGASITCTQEEHDAFMASLEG